MALEKRRVAGDGLVHCPLRGRNVDVELCLGCPRLEDFDLDSRQPSVTCRMPEVGESPPIRARTT